MEGLDKTLDNSDRVLKLVEDVKKLSEGGKIVVYGAGLLAKYLLLKTPLKDLNIIGVVDNDEKKWGKFIGKFKIYTPDELLKKADFALVAMSNFNENLAYYLKSQNKKALFINRTLYYIMSQDIECDDKIDDICIKIKRKDFEPNIGKVLILKLDYFGDTMLSLPFLYEVRAKYKHAFIDVMCTAENYNILKELGIFSKLYVVKEFSRSKEGISIDEALKTLDKYDVAIDVGFGPDTRYLINYIKADYKIALESFDDIDNNLHIKIPYIYKSETITKLLMDYASLLPDIKSQKPAKNHIKNIAIFPSPSSKVKQWIHFEEFVRLLEKENIENINIYSDSKAFNIDSSKIHYHINLNFRTLLDSLSQNDIAISVDSFGAHVSSYAGLPVICIFFDSSTLGFSPSYSDSIIVFKQSMADLSQNMDIIECDKNIYCYKSEPSDINPKTILDILKKFYKL